MRNHLQNRTSSFPVFLSAVLRENPSPLLPVAVPYYPACYPLFVLSQHSHPLVITASASTPFTQVVEVRRPLLLVFTPFPPLTFSFCPADRNNVGSSSPS